MTVTEFQGDEDYRLPRHSKPVRYVLRLAPDLELATFSGEEVLELDVLESTSVIVMNACDLEIERATIAVGAPSTGESQATPVEATISFDREQERVSFTFSSPFPPGRYEFRCTFRGVLNDKLCGFYKSTFVDEDGIGQTIATTQFEETDARKAFPCFDEPDRKAIFDVTLDVASGMTALSNGPELSRVDLGDGTERVHFGETIPMSTYLVAFIVGPLEATAVVDVDGVALRVFTVPGRTSLAGLALEIGAHSLRFFSDYFEIGYPGSKLDLVALPDFASGAMENLGCVTFREATLLADPENASRGEVEMLVEVVAHEIAHMWFGDLVTMNWWNGIWLNEAFATFMALQCQDDFRPSWNSFGSFSRSKAGAFYEDALHATRPIEFPVRHPEEAAAMFDVLTYEKGASILWMIEQFLGRDRFRAGIRNYLRAHLYGSTETSDLWDALEGEAGSLPIRNIMNTWIFQGGFPAVSIQLDNGESGAAIALRQEPFSYLPGSEQKVSAIGSNWLIPIIAASIGLPNETTRIILGSETEIVPTNGTPLVINSGGSGFYRVHYDDVIYATLSSRLADLTEIERFNLTSDTWAFILAGRSALSRICDLGKLLRDDLDPYIWSILIGAFGLMNSLVPTKRRGEFESFAKEQLRPLFDQIGWTPNTGDNEQTPLLRAALVSSLGIVLEDENVIKHCRDLFGADLSGLATVDGDLAASVLGVVASHADEYTFDLLVERYRNPRDPNDQLRHLGALAKLGDNDLAARVHQMCLGEIRSQNAPYVIRAMLLNHKINAATWAFVSKHYDEIVRRFPENSIPRMLDGISGLGQLDENGDPVLANDVREFCDTNIHGARRKLVERSLESLEINLRLAKRLISESFSS